MPDGFTVSRHNVRVGGKKFRGPGAYNQGMGKSSFTALEPLARSIFRIVAGFLFSLHGFQKLFGAFGGIGGRGAKAEFFSPEVSPKIFREIFEKRLAEMGGVRTVSLPFDWAWLRQTQRDKRRRRNARFFSRIFPEGFRKCSGKVLTEEEPVRLLSLFP